MNTKASEPSEALTDFDDAVSDVASARHDSIRNALERFLRLLETEEYLSSALKKLPVVDFEQWHEEARRTSGGMAGRGTLNWPIEKPPRVAMQLALVRYLASGKEEVWRFAHQFMYAGSNVADNAAAFLDQVFLPFARDFRRMVERTARNSRSSTTGDTDVALKIFLSHSDKDKEVAIPLIDLFSTALKLQASEIRCTSVDGYRLPGGADTDEQLRLEVHTTRAFVGLISPASVDSMFVMFELGARWGAEKHLIPLLAPGADASLLRGPLAGINALRCDNRAQLQQLVEDLGRVLDVAPESPAGYEKFIEAVLKLPPVQPPAQRGDEESGEAHRPLTAAECNIMALFANQRKGLTVAEVAIELKISEQKAKYYLDELVRTHELLTWVGNMDSMVPDRYPLMHEGRAYLLKHGLI